MRNNRQFQQVLDAARRAAEAHKEQQDRLAEAMEERYGATHSDVDDDGLIDALTYGTGGRVTVAECDHLMAAAGRPRIQPTRPTEERNARKTDERCGLSERD